jgi:hypothetical protein
MINVIRDKERKQHYQIMICDKSLYKYYDSLTIEPELAEEYHYFNLKVEDEECIWQDC